MPTRRSGRQAAHQAWDPTGLLAAQEEEPAAVKTKRRARRDPLTVFLVLIIVFSLVLAGLIGGELYARHVANSKVAQAVACVVKDQATASFGVAPLLLWQVATRHFTNISVETAGNQIRDAKGMQIKLTIQNVRLKNTPNSRARSAPWTPPLPGRRKASRNRCKTRFRSWALSSPAAWSLTPQTAPSN